MTKAVHDFAGNVQRESVIVRYENPENKIKDSDSFKVEKAGIIGH